MEQFVERGGCKLYYDVRGSGPVVLWIQGVGVHGGGWRPQIDALSNGFTCISFDNRGMGRSHWNGSSVTVEQMAEDARAILQAEKIESAHVVGHSLGGLVALQLALSAKAMVKSLSLLCTFPSGKLAAPLTWRMMWLGMRSRVGPRTMRRRGFMQLIHPPGHAGLTDQRAIELAELFGHDLADQPPIVGPQLNALRAAHLTDRLKELAVPTLILSGKHDPISPPKSGRALHEGIIGSTFVEFPDASHGLPITHAREVNQHLREHFDRVK